MNITELVGKRCLLSVKIGWQPSVDEYKVLEVSLSGNWIKLMNIYGKKFWKPIQEVSFVEELRDLKADKPE